MKILIATALVLAAALAVRAQEKSAPPPDAAALQAEVARLKGMVPDQSHAMSDVGRHFTNLWFAGQAGNWPLAQFCPKRKYAGILEFKPE